MTKQSQNIKNLEKSYTSPLRYAEIVPVFHIRLSEMKTEDPRGTGPRSSRFEIKISRQNM